MNAQQFLVGAIVFAGICWLILAALFTGFSPTPALTYVFYAVLALAITCTLVPAVYYLHARFGDARENPRWGRYIRQALWPGVLAAFFLWLNSLQALSIPALVLGICIAGLMELVVLRPAKSES